MVSYGRSARAASLEVEKEGDATAGGLQIYMGGDWRFAGTREIMKLYDSLLAAAAAHGLRARIDLYLWRSDAQWHHRLKALG